MKREGTNYIENAEIAKGTEKLDLVFLHTVFHKIR